MKIINKTSRDLGLQPELIVSAGGSLEIDNEVLTKLKSLPSVKHLFAHGHLVEDGAVPASEPESKKMTEREAAIAGIIRGLDPEDFTQSGSPEVSAINAALPDGVKHVTAAERDVIWATMSGD